MSTAHRPTYFPSKGGRNQGGTRRDIPTASVSVHALPQYMTLKTRQPGQHPKEETKQKEDLREELAQKEKQNLGKEQKQQQLVAAEEQTVAPMRMLPAIADLDRDEELVSSSDEEDERTHRVRKVQSPLSGDAGEEAEVVVESPSKGKAPLINHDVDSDAKKPGSSSKNGDSDEDEDDDDDDDEDDDLELMRELEKIRNERAQEKKKKELEESALKQQIRGEEMRNSNPLLSADFSLKRRWDDDVVFKNQARTEVKTPKRFINDTVRNDFHRRFMEKFVQ